MNSHDQPVGPTVEGWTPRPLPTHAPIDGRFCRIEPLDADCHARDLFAAYAQAPDGRDWTYLPAERRGDFLGFKTDLKAQAASLDPLHHAIIDHASGKPSGTAALMRIDAGNGVIEVGHIVYARRLQRTPAGTEALYLLMRRVFDELGYRRLEWKCDSLNQPSRRAALRYGFSFEGTFRQALVTKGRNRDTAWFSMLDSEWPENRDAFESWLSADNFREDGTQRHSLASHRGGVTDGVA